MPSQSAKRTMTRLFHALLFTALAADALRLTMKYCLNVRIAINPARRTEFIANIKNNALGTRTMEPGNVLYTWGESTTTPNVFHFQEQFLNKEAFIAHTKAPHFAEWEKFAQSPNAFLEPPVVQFFEEL